MVSSTENKFSRSGTPSLEAVFVQTGCTWKLDLLPMEEEALVVVVMVGEELTVVTAGEDLVIDATVWDELGNLAVE